MPSRGQAWPREVRERAVRMVLEHQHEYGSQWEAICSVAEKLGPTAETVRKWVRRAEVNGGARPGRPSEELETTVAQGAVVVVHRLQRFVLRCFHDASPCRPAAHCDSSGRTTRIWYYTAVITAVSLEERCSKPFSTG